MSYRPLTTCIVPIKIIISEIVCAIFNSVLSSGKYYKFGTFTFILMMIFLHLVMEAFRYYISIKLIYNVDFW